MLRRQKPDQTPMSFLAGPGEMAGRIRAFDWARHPFGPPENWPASLRSALGIALNSAFPTAIYWGPELRLLYNDAWSAIPGPRHPDCLGQPAEAVWSDIWHVIEPQFARVIETGEGLFLDDQHLPMRRYGYEEETYWSYNFTPIRGEDGRIEGIFNSGQETTDKVLKQRQTAFLLQASDRFRSLSEPGQVMTALCEMLGGHLRAIRVGIRETGRDNEPFPISTEWAAPGWNPVGQGASWTSLGPITDRLQAGSAARIERTATLDIPEARAVFARLGAGSALAVPWFRAGRLSAVLFVHRAEAGPWRDEEIFAVEQVLGRAMQAIDAERMALREKAMLMEVEHRARNLLGISQALVRLSQAEDVESFKHSLLDRMGALGQTVGLLSAANWAGADFGDLLRAELAPFLSGDGARVTLEGPRVIVAPDMAQPVAMAIHELTTNAVKYGGLSEAAGTLAVGWQVGPGGALQIDWAETFPDRAPTGPDSAGFGSRLLSLTIESQLDGSFEREVRAGGFTCRIEIPLGEG